MDAWQVRDLSVALGERSALTDSLVPNPSALRLRDPHVRALAGERAARVVDAVVLGHKAATRDAPS